MIVDDGGDATIICIEGLAAEKKLAQTGALTEPARGALS
jgi:hypothetical protein